MWNKMIFCLYYRIANFITNIVIFSRCSESFDQISYVNLICVKRSSSYNSTLYPLQMIVRKGLLQNPISHLVDLPQSEISNHQVSSDQILFFLVSMRIFFSSGLCSIWEKVHPIDSVFSNQFLVCPWLMDSMSPPNPRLTSPLKVNTETSDGPSLTLPHQLTRHACILPLQAVLLITEIR